MRVGVLLGGAAAVTLAALGCSSSGSGESVGNGSGGRAGGSAHDAGDGPSPLLDASPADAAGGCEDGLPCGDGGVCAGGSCCDAERACAGACCDAGAVCSFGACVVPGAACTDSSDCAADAYCEPSLGAGASDAGVAEAGLSDATCAGGVASPSGRCLPRPPVCAPDAGAPDAGMCLQACEVRPVPGAFAPTLTFAWGGQTAAPYATDVMMAPIVVQLDDDDCDGKVTARDLPDIVFTTFSGGDYHHAGVVHAISIVGGAVVAKWASAAFAEPGLQLAGGDLDGVPGSEIVACGADGAVHALRPDGTEAWKSAALACAFPSIGDLDGDGHPEVVVEGGVLDGATGATKATFVPAMVGSFVLSDVDVDGALDVVGATAIWRRDGTQALATTLVGKYPAVADLDRDGVPEIVTVDFTSHAAAVWHLDPTQPAGWKALRTGVDVNGALSPTLCAAGSSGATHGGGPPTLADFDGDGTPDVALAGGVGYVVLDGKRLLDPSVAASATVMWQARTTDCSSASTGSSVFDFDGDGKAEVVYSDQNHLRVYEGPTGRVLWETCNTTGTLQEYPLIADVDADGHADIVVASNAYAKGSPDVACTPPGGTNGQSGVRVFGDPQGNWVRTRRVWNEHAYHVTNVDEDGTIPAHERANWLEPGLDNFRQNKQPGGEFSAPDAVVSVAPVCNGAYGLVATVRNLGEAALPAGVLVGFYAGTPPTGAPLGQAATQKPLYPAESTTVTLALPSPPSGVVDGTTPVYAVVDDGGAPHPSWRQCRTDDDTSATVSARCSGPH